MMTGVSKHLVQVLQFIIVLILAAQFSWNWMRRTPQRPGTGVPGAKPRSSRRPGRARAEGRAMGQGGAYSTLMEIAFSAIRISTPLIFAAMGGLLTYQAGILNIALDGFMIVAAFAAICVAFATGNLVLGVAAGIFAAIVLAALLAAFNLKFRAHIFIAGIAVTFLAYGLTALLLKGVLGQEGVFQSNRIPHFPTIRHSARGRHPGPRAAGQRAHHPGLCRLSVRARRGVLPLPDALGAAGCASSARRRTPRRRPASASSA